ncbi:MAG TPA: amidohydrolase family protein [Burkholderiaceae bacterium]|nr:amidohydrolase family protein [Burkholderiaceae bacterium]
MKDRSFDPNLKPAQKRLPAGSCDCHFHVFEDVAVFPVADTATYVPALASLTDYERLCREYGIDRAVLVHPSTYGSDHSSYEKLMQENRHWMRGVVVAPVDVSEKDLERWHDLGTRGTRVNMLYASARPSMDDLHVIIDKVKPLGWHLQMIADVSVDADALKAVADREIPVVIDHLGHGKPGQLIESAGFATLCALMREGRAWVKLSAPYRLSRQAPQYTETRVLVDALLKAGPEQAVWGTDWPHPNFDGPMPNDGDLVDLAFDWLPDSALQQAVLVDNPARLYWSE